MPHITQRKHITIQEQSRDRQKIKSGRSSKGEKMIDEGDGKNADFRKWRYICGSCGHRGEINIHKSVPLFVSGADEILNFGMCPECEPAYFTKDKYIIPKGGGEKKE